MASQASGLLVLIAITCLVSACAEGLLRITARASPSDDLQGSAFGGTDRTACGVWRGDCDSDECVQRRRQERASSEQEERRESLKRHRRHEEATATGAAAAAAECTAGCMRLTGRLVVASIGYPLL
jgi:hypothetical protein